LLWPWIHSFKRWFASSVSAGFGAKHLGVLVWRTPRLTHNALPSQRPPRPVDDWVLQAAHPKEKSMPKKKRKVSVIASDQDIIKGDIQMRNNLPYIMAIVDGSVACS
jgi:hypothetical protein